MARELHVSFTIEQDENGTWGTKAALTPTSFAYGQGPTREAAIEDLKNGILSLIDSEGIPEQVVVTVEGD